MRACVDCDEHVDDVLLHTHIHTYIHTYIHKYSDFLLRCQVARDNCKPSSRVPSICFFTDLFTVTVAMEDIVHAAATTVDQSDGIYKS